MVTQSQNPFRALYDLAKRYAGSIIPDAAQLTIASIGVAALDASNVAPGLMKEWVQDVEEYVGRNGQFTKLATLYVGAHPPPAAWPYYCGRCRWWQEPDRCVIVKGDIYFAGWCSLWSPPDGPDGRPSPPFVSYLWYLADMQRLLQDIPKFLQAPIGREL